jgi:glycosyltransferase involved in cell wall biosynthesis
MVVTIHDLVHLKYNFVGSLTAWLYAQAMLRLAASKAAHIITVSEFSKAEIVEQLRVPACKVSVIYHGISPEFGQIDHDTALARVMAAWRVPGPYLLYVGNLKPHKNIVTLLRAFAKLRDADELPHNLLIVGEDPRGKAQLAEEISRLHLERAAILLSAVRSSELPDLYAGASAFVLPSYIEGFGFPVLEAMACGTPVVCSSAACLPEICGNAAVFFDPFSVDELASALRAVLESGTRQAQLRASGLERAKAFSWRTSAERHCEIYREMLQI